MSDDINEKRDGFGIGEAGRAPETTAADEIEAERIRSAQRSTPMEFPCTKCGGAKQEGSAVYREAVQLRVMGSAVLCESCLRAYFAKLGSGSTLEQEVEAKKYPASGRCGVCGAKTTNWVSGAGQYLCSRHEDDY